ncbi:ASI1-immunoprecipitated protein 2-like [Silene latifolia]|uniref:ASI1-immunoprecipitated protein 2-like n=1 Tax=Silene latifolia TaxID=37657 RepID=UPI003D787A8A
MSAEEKLLSRSLIVSDKRRDQKSLMQDSDGDSSSRRANHSTDSVCLHSDKYNDGASCGADTSNNLGQEVEIADGVTISGSEGLCSDNEDKQLEFKKCSRYLGTSNHELTSSSSDKYQDGDEKIFKSNKRDESDEARAPSVPTSPESDVEEDVKVCDICGDAGREDLLAVCSRCSDGAEHTYCMREMLDKVPEVDWLCEECKHNELLEARQLDQSKKIGSHERNKPLGRTCSLLPDLSLKLDNKDPACDRLRLRNLSLSRQSSSKICGERVDSCSTAKKQILESSVGSPTMSSPSRMAVLSKDVPFKILDNIKGKPSNQISTGTKITGEFSENAHSPTTNSPHFVKGNFLKSNSFSSSNSRQNVKVSEDVLQKHSVDAKEGIGKSIGPIGKSMSFKGLGRSSSTEPKVKMLPADCAPFQDLKGPKHGKDRTSYERKNTIKLDNSLPGQIAADSTNRSSAVSDGISTLPVTSTRDYRNVQSDGKLPNLSNHAGHLTQKSSDIMRNIGEAKKLSTGIVGSTYVNGTSNAVETKFNHLNTNDGLAVSSSRPVDGSLNADGARSNGQGSQNEKAPEKISGSSRQGLNSGMVSGSRRRLPLDASALKSKDGMPGENKLKAAIEAAMQKKQDILKKNKIPEKPVELPISNKQGNHGGDAVSNHVRDPKSEEAMHEGDMDLHDINLDSSIQIPIIGEKPIKLYPADFEKSPAGESVLTVSAIPEQESIWQGGFEIHRNGKPPDMRGGFQAHMSLFASGKVHEMVGKFPKKIIFNEVPRPCAWPAQFKELGPREDHIALYFFAKDSESYMRSYKILVDYMMKHDLALRGNINGIELLVFPSNHLPHESKCWNALYFIWGVFRGRKPRFLDDRFSSGKCEISVPDKVVLHKGVTSAENPFLYNKLAPEQLSVSASDHNLVSRCEASVKEGSSLQLCSSLSNGDCYKEEYSVGRTCMNSAIGAENHKKRPKNHDTILREACPETGSAALGEQYQGKHRRMVDLQKLTAEINKDKSLPSEVTLDQQDCSQPLQLPLVGKQEVDTVVSSVNLEMLDPESDYVSRLKYDNGVKQEKRCLVTMQKSSLMELENDIDKKKIELPGQEWD